MTSATRSQPDMSSVLYVCQSVPNIIPTLSSFTVEYVA